MSVNTEEKTKKNSNVSKNKAKSITPKDPEFYLPVGYPDFSKAPISTNLGVDITEEVIHKRKKVPALNTQYLRTVLKDRDPFMAFCLGLEEPLLKAYDDGYGNQTIGVGYCIPARVRTYGVDRVVKDFMAAGLNKTQATALAKQDKEALKTIKLTPHGAIALLEVIKDDYINDAKNAIGENTWNKLPKNKQVALAYMCYNTGGLKKDLVNAVRRGDDYAAMSGYNMMPKLTDCDNHILRGRVQAAFMGGKLFDQAILDPGVIDAKYGNPAGENALPNMVLLNNQKSVAQKLKDKHNKHKVSSNNDVEHKHQNNHS